MDPLRAQGTLFRLMNATYNKMLPAPLKVPRHSGQVRESRITSKNAISANGNM
jgi:hypothetical protein